MKIARIFAQAFVRRLAFVLAAIVLAWVGIGTAHAASYTDQGAAYAGCMVAVMGKTSGTSVGGCMPQTNAYKTTWLKADGTWGNSIGTGGQDSLHTWPAGMTCSARPDGAPGLINGTLTSTGICNNGCKMIPNMDPGGDDFSLGDSANPNAVSFKRGSWVAHGSVCNPNEFPDVPSLSEQQGCHTTESGHKVCRGQGKTCVTAPSGFVTCAADDAVTGDPKATVKTNNPRTEATSISAPNTPPSAPVNRTGENWQKGGNAGTVTNNTTSTVTNVAYYNNEGTPNGNEPTPGDGSGGDGGSGEDEGGHGEVGGDGTCQGSFTCSGGDPVLCAMAQQTYLARCEADARAGGSAAPFPGNGDGGAGDDPSPEDVHKSVTVGLGMLDDTGFLGGGQCPNFGSINVMGKTIELDPDGKWCDLIAVARKCLLLLGAFIALSILVGRSDA